MFSDFVRDRPGLVILLLALLSTVPLLIPSLPPLTDLLGHIGRYRVQLDLDDTLCGLDRGDRYLQPTCTAQIGY